MKKIFENGGILAQVPIMLAVLILFPIFGTDTRDVAVKVDASFYIWQGLLCVAPILAHVVFMKKRPELEEGTQKGIVWTLFLVSFILTVLNCMRFTPAY